MRISKAIILSAGQGNRLGKFTKEIPKPMIKVNNLPILEHNINLCTKFGVEDIFINLHHLPHKIKDYFKDGFNHQCKIHYNYEKELLGTAGALMGFQKYLENESLIVIYGDNYFKNHDLNHIYKFHIKNNSDFTIHAHWLSDCSMSGRLEICKENKLIKIFEKEKSDIPKSGYVSSGIFIINNMDLIKELLFIGADFAYDILPNLIQKTNIFVFKSNKTIYAIDNEILLNKTQRDLMSD